MALVLQSHKILKKQSEYLKLLKDWNFKTSSLNKVASSIDEIDMKS